MTVTKVTGAWAEPDEETITKTVENLLKLKVGYIRGIYHARRTTDLYTSSTSYVDCLSLTVDAKAGDKVIILVAGRSWPTSDSASGHGQFVRDGTILIQQHIIKGGTNSNLDYAMCYVDSISADGTYTYKFQVRTNGTSVNFYDDGYPESYEINLIVIVIGGV